MFGSVWGLLECTLGAFLHATHLPSGAVMTTVAFSLMTASRLIFKVRGMQIFMGMIAATYKLLNLGFIVGCIWCPMVAIIVEAIIFEGMFGIPLLMRAYEKNKIISSRNFNRNLH